MLFQGLPPPPTLTNSFACCNNLTIGQVFGEILRHLDNQTYV